MKTLGTSLVAAAALLAVASAAPAQAQWQPSKPITIIVPWSAGGSTDQVTRVVAGELSEALGQNVVVVNRCDIDVLDRRRSGLERRVDIDLQRRGFAAAVAGVGGDDHAGVGVLAAVLDGVG